MGTGSFPGVESGRGVTLTPRPLLVPRYENSRALPLLFLRAFVACKKGETYILGIVIHLITYMEYSPTSDCNGLPAKESKVV
jgi:hypothetical protein